MSLEMTLPDKSREDHESKWNRRKKKSHIPGLIGLTLLCLLLAYALSHAVA